MESPGYLTKTEPVFERLLRLPIKDLPPFLLRLRPLLRLGILRIVNCDFSFAMASVFKARVVAASRFSSGTLSISG